MNLGFGFASLLDGLIFEVSGGYQVTLMINVVLGVVAAIAAALVPYFGHERQRRQVPLGAPERGSVPARATG
jgi:hypothetical protein